MKPDTTTEARYERLLAMYDELDTQHVNTAHATTAAILALLAEDGTISAKLFDQLVDAAEAISEHATDLDIKDREDRDNA